MGPNFNQIPAIANIIKNPTRGKNRKFILMKPLHFQIAWREENVKFHDEVFTDDHFTIFKRMEYEYDLHMFENTPVFY